METQNLKQRIKDEQPSATVAGDDVSDRNPDTTSGRRESRKSMAKRGLRSLGVAVSTPTLLTLINIYFFGTNDIYKMSNKPNWVPPIWTLHMACLGSAFLMGLCGWIVWAEGGFHRKPRALPLYLGQFGLSLVWDPLVFKMGANWAGLVVALGILWALFQCYRVFRQVNQIAGDLVLPCLAWAGFLAFVNLKLLVT